jgi:hypothetical protein
MSSQQGDTGSASVHTYHCLCSQLLLAGATLLEDRRKRAGESLDNAYIVPLMPSDVLFSDQQGSDEEETENAQPTTSLREGVQSYNASILLNTVLERKPLVVRRSDGFETRYQRRCGRCELVVGYHLDGAQFGGGEKSGRIDKIIYILPGALKTTSDMMESKNT